MTQSTIRATPFHARIAAINSHNRWVSRNGFTLAADFGDAQAEALAARTGVVVADISWRWRVHLEGARSSEMISYFSTRDFTELAPGEAAKALWLNDAGAVRGVGAFARSASDGFLLVSAGLDSLWLTNAARQFDVTIQDVTSAEGGLALIGPYAGAVLDRAGLSSDVVLLGFRKLFWRGLDVTVSRWGEHGGYEIWCGAEDCLVLWDRLMRAGTPFGIRAAGLDAGDILDIEAGIPRPGRDFSAANDGLTVDPAPASLGLESLIDGETHLFNGRSKWLERRKDVSSLLVGLEIDSEIAAPFTPLSRSGNIVGHSLTSVRSPFLRRAIALAQIEKQHAETGTEFSLAIPSSLGRIEARSANARVVSLPFVTPPDPIPLEQLNLSLEEGVKLS